MSKAAVRRTASNTLRHGHAGWEKVYPLLQYDRDLTEVREDKTRVDQTDKANLQQHGGRERVLLCMTSGALRG